MCIKNDFSVNKLIPERWFLFQESFQANRFRFGMSPVKSNPMKFSWSLAANELKSSDSGTPLLAQCATFSNLLSFEYFIYLRFLNIVYRP